MAVNDFLLWATDDNANVLTQAQYVARGDRASGVQSGKASGQQANKTWRQSSIMSRMIAQFIIDRVNADVIDSGAIATIEADFIRAIQSLFVIPPTGVVPGTYGPTVTIAVQADGRVTSLANTGLTGTGVVAGRYVGATVTVRTDGRISDISSDWVRVYSAPNSFWTKTPDGTIDQTFGYGLDFGNGPQARIVNLPVANPTAIGDATVWLAGSVPPGSDNPGSISIQPWTPGQVLITSNYAFGNLTDPVLNGPLGVVARVRGF